MVDVDSIYGPSNYLRASDLPPKPVTYTIEGVDVRTFDGAQKLVLIFRDERKALILNKTNASILAGMFGRETELWKGREVTLAKRLITTSDGRQVMGIRVLRPGARPEDEGLGK